MANPSKGKGTAAETAVARYLEVNGWPYAERRSLNGALDKGDITGTPGLCWEVKAGWPLQYSAWLDELRVETHHAKATHGILVSKPRGVGVGRVEVWHAVMEAAEFDNLATGSWLPLRVLPAERYAMDRVKLSLGLKSRAFCVLDLTRLGLRDRPDRNYRVMHLADMVMLLRSVGYGNPLEVNT